jgi:hypothetical protein
MSWSTRVGRGGTTAELLPLNEVMQGSSGSRCKRCITLTRGRRRDGNIINDSIGEGGGGGTAVVVRVEEEANVSRVGSRRGRSKLFGFGCDRVAGGDETGKGGKFVARNGSEGITDAGFTGGSFVEAAGKKIGHHRGPGGGGSNSRWYQGGGLEKMGRRRWRRRPIW